MVYNYFTYVHVTIIIVGSFGQDQGGFECHSEGCRFGFNVKITYSFTHPFIHSTNAH